MTKTFGSLSYCDLYDYLLYSVPLRYTVEYSILI